MHNQNIVDANPKLVKDYLIKAASRVVAATINIERPF